MSEMKSTRSGQLISIQGAEVTRIDHRGEPVVTFAMVDRVHQRPDGTAKRNFNENEERFESGTDFVRVSLAEIRAAFPHAFPARGGGDVTLITRRGYLKLTKPMNDDRAWAVQGEMVDRYFAVETRSSLQEEIAAILPALLPALVEAFAERVASDPRHVAVADVSVKEILDDQRVPSKGRRSLQSRVFSRLKDHCLHKGIAAKRCARTGTWLFPVIEAKRFVHEQCASMIRDHIDRLGGQGRLRLVQGEAAS